MRDRGTLKVKKLLRYLTFLVLLGTGSFAAWLYHESRAPEKPLRVLVRFDRPTDLLEALNVLREKGAIRNARASFLLATLTGKSKIVPTGTYRFAAGSSSMRILRDLSSPIHQFVRLPETNWAARTARLLEKNDVCTADEYLSLVSQPEQFQTLVDFPLPTGTLEGYLYPDTYELPPMLGARRVIEMQLQAFSSKVWGPLRHPSNLNDIVTIGSMVELEVKFDNERPMVAGVIENRLKVGMPLQIDAAINYGLQEWRALAVSEYRTVQSPYNLYLHKGLPPTPICSPSEKSIAAALAPAKHEFLYYVAMPDGVSVFARTYPEHLKNVKRRRDAMKALRAIREISP